MAIYAGQQIGGHGQLSQSLSDALSALNTTHSPPATHNVLAASSPIPPSLTFSADTLLPPTAAYHAAELEAAEQAADRALLGRQTARNKAAEEAKARARVCVREKPPQHASMRLEPLTYLKYLKRLCLVLHL